MSGGRPTAVAHTAEFLADSLTPLEVYRRLAAVSPHRFLFESVTGGDQVSRFSLLGAGPRSTCRLLAEGLEVERDGGRTLEPGPPLAALARVTGAIDAPRGQIPLTGGWAGYFGFDLVRHLERLPPAPPDPFALPAVELGRFDRVVVFDHARQRVVAVANEIPGEVSAAAARRDLEELGDLLTSVEGGGAVELPSAAGPESPGSEPAATVSIGGADFRAAVAAAKRRIFAGDIFQVVLARRWRLGAAVEPLALYRALRLVNPSPYMVLYESPAVALVGASPEMLVRREGSRVETRPIAGTRPRGADAAADERLAAELLADEKERAEHVMLVDLGRNDLGRVSRPGTVQVPRFMEIERYSHVMHIVSEVVGELGPGRSGLDALLAAFPAGTVSGAPKIRAMEILSELEPEARGPYAGACGYLSFSGDVDTCITIRTLVVRENEISVTAGAGIVADSDPEREERETEEKAAALLAAVELARRLERFR